MRISEKLLVDNFCDFLIQQDLVCIDDCHFGPDNANLADLELTLKQDRWRPVDISNHLLIEAKSHHSKDSPNTINKIFGQLLKETGKPVHTSTRRQDASFGVLFPAESVEWDSNGNTIRRPSGNQYYRNGFRRINRDAYIGFGNLVNAKYVLSFSTEHQHLQVFDWVDFYDYNDPICNLGA